MSKNLKERLRLIGEHCLVFIVGGLSLFFVINFIMVIFYIMQKLYGFWAVIIH